MGLYKYMFVYVFYSIEYACKVVFYLYIMVKGCKSLKEKRYEMKHFDLCL